LSLIFFGASPDCFYFADPEIKADGPLFREKSNLNIPVQSKSFGRVCFKMGTMTPLVVTLSR